MGATIQEALTVRPHPRVLGWVGTTALAMGGSNQSLFLIAALFGGQGDIPGLGSPTHRFPEGGRGDGSCACNKRQD